MSSRYLRFTFFASLMLAVGCGDKPVRSPVDLEHGGVVIDQDIRFRYADRYSFGFAFTPSFASGGTWQVSDFEAERRRAWTEFCPAVDISIVDSSNVLRMHDAGDVSPQSGWIITNGSQGDEPASVYKYVTFTPQPHELYHVRVRVLRGCSGANALRPFFFVQRPVAML